MDAGVGRVGRCADEMERRNVVHGLGRDAEITCRAEVSFFLAMDGGSRVLAGRGLQVSEEVYTGQLTHGCAARVLRCQRV